MTDLLPCPFCGHPPKLNEFGYVHRTEVQIECVNDQCYNMPSTACREDRAEAIAAWNSRIEVPAKPTISGGTPMDAKDRERQAFVDELLAAGWTWSGEEKNVLRSPVDDAHYVYVDPYTKEALLCPALIEALRQQLGRPSA